MKRFLSPRFWLLPALAALLVTACEKPARSGAETETKPGTEEPNVADAADAPSNPPDAADEPDPVAATHPSDPPAKPEPELPPEDSVEPVLEVKKTGDKILITGHFRSFRQEEDMLRILTHNFPDHEVVSELDLGTHVKPVGGWGNRICTLLVPLFQESGNTARFHYKAGAVTVDGEVPSAPQREHIHRQVSYVMDDSSIAKIDVKLKVVP